MYKNDMKNNKNECFLIYCIDFMTLMVMVAIILQYISLSILNCHRVFHDLFKNFYCDILKTKGKLKIMRDSITHMYGTHIMTTRNIKSVHKFVVAFLNQFLY